MNARLVYSIKGTPFYKCGICDHGYRERKMAELCCALKHSKVVTKRIK